MCLLYMIAVASDVQNLLLRKEFAHAAAQQVDYSTAMGFCYWVWWICFFFWGGGGGGIEVTEELCVICTSYSLPEWQAITNILAP